MTTLYRKAFLLALMLSLLTGMGLVISNRAEISEAVQVATCREPCPALAPKQLRLNVIKAFLHHLLESNIDRHDFGGDDQLVLLPRDMTAQGIALGIKNSTLLDTLTSHSTVLKTHAQIDALTVQAIAGESSIAVYSLPHRTAEITPTRGIHAASVSEVETYFRSHGADTPIVTSWERRRGYGQHFFWITPYWYISLVCCDGRGDQNGATPDWSKRNDLLTLKSIRPRLMAVSHHGAILFRSDDGESSSFIF